MIFRTILFLVFVESFYSVIYVSESGSDTTGCGTVGTPCKTLTYAFNSSTSLDVVMLPGFVAGPLRLTFSFSLVFFFFIEVYILFIYY
jgi:hypothetical protein